MLVKILIAVLIVWNLLATFFLWRIFSFYRSLTRGVKEGNLKRILKLILKKGSLSEKNIGLLEKKIARLERGSKSFLKKVGLVRFNPFSELGGDQSFSLAILNEKDQGIIVTSLHGRQTTRIYTKLVNDRKEKQNLSKEELSAINKTRSKK